MKKYDLSILIPARNEMFLKRTVEDALLHKKGNTEILVGIDEESADALPDHDDLVIVYVSQSIGQRAMTNLLARYSDAKYVMKVDAHCAFDEGFDVKLMADMKDNWTVVPMMYNLHVFDWVCTKCKNRRYQGPTKPCPKCGSLEEREIIWKPRLNKKSTAYRFDKTLHFQYWGDYKVRQKGDIVDTFSIQGSCFMLTRDKYWELDICDEGHGSWGQQGTEVACKTWLSGGEVKVNKKTWYSHMFRTQGGDFGFPYPISGKAQDYARQYSRDLFLNNKFKKAIHPFSWLIEKFKPIPDWHDTTIYNIPDKKKKGIIYYTDNQLNLKIAHAVQRQLKSIGLPIVSASLKPMTHFGKNISLPLERGYLTLFRQILAALEASDSEIIYFCEHDNLVHPSRFDFTPPKKDIWYYNRSWWKVRLNDGLSATWNADQVSGICVYRSTAIEYYKKRIDTFNRGLFDRKFEPMSGTGSEVYHAKYPDIDIRHEKNLTLSKWSLDDFRDKSTGKGFKTGTLKDIPGWDLSDGVLKAVALR